MERKTTPRLLTARAWLAALCCALALPFLPAARAAPGTAPPHAASAPAPVSASLARRARTVVQAQLNAFAADDASRAFSFASPGIRKAFDGPEHFMAMVKAHYPVVHRPASVTFLKAAWIDGALTQGVQLADATGTVWLAVYQLEQQRDKSWRIAACEVFPSQGRMV
jgi:Domain of unknown function (DUF4864)